MRCLVLRGGALGDFVVTLPALRHLRAASGATHVELIGNAAAAHLGMQAGLLDRVHSQHEQRWAALYGEAPLSSDLRAFLREFDLILNFWPDPDGVIDAHLAANARRHVCAPPLPASGPAGMHYLQAAARATSTTCKEEDLHVRLPFASAREDILALHPGSGSRSKNWPLSRWIEVCRRLPGQKLIVGGEADIDALAELRPFGEILHNAPLIDLARRLAGCAGFLGHDSGVSHVAAAVGTPCLLLFGPTDPTIWAPPGRHVRVLRKGSRLEEISVQEVLAATASGRASPV